MRDSMNIIAEVIASRRKELGLSQKALAEKLHVSDKTLSRWETGKQIPDALTLQSIAGALGLSVSEMYGGKETAATQPVQQKRFSFRKLLKHTGIGIAALAAAAALVTGIGNHRMQSRVSYAVREVPMYALTSYDHSVLDWIKTCNTAGAEISCLSSLQRDYQTGEDVAHYLFYLPHGYADTEVKVRYRPVRNGNVLKLDFKNTTQTMDDDFYLCYVKVIWDEEGFSLETTLDGESVRLQSHGSTSYFVELCQELFDDAQPR